MTIILNLFQGSILCLAFMASWASPMIDVWQFTIERANAVKAFPARPELAFIIIHITVSTIGLLIYLSTLRWFAGPGPKPGRPWATLVWSLIGVALFSFGNQIALIQKILISKPVLILALVLMSREAWGRLKPGLATLREVS